MPSDIELAEKNQAMQSSNLVLSNRRDMELVRFRIGQILERIDVQEAPDRLERLTKLWEKYTEAMKNGMRVESTKLMVELDKEFGKARTDFASWQQIFDAIELDRKLIESEVKVLKDMKAIMTAEDAHELAAKLLSIIVESIQHSGINQEHKSELIGSISFEFTRLVGGDGAGQSDRGSRGSAQESTGTGPGGLDREPVHNPGDQADQT